MLLPFLHYFTRSDLHGGEKLMAARPGVGWHARPLLDGLQLGRLGVQDHL